MLEVWENSHSSIPLGCPEPGDVAMNITRAPTPPPFQFSSSSLITALSGPSVQQSPTNSCRSPSLPPECCDGNESCSPEVDPPSIEVSPPPEPVADSFTPLLNQSEIYRDYPLVYSDPIQSIHSTPIQLPEPETAAGSDSDENDCLPSTSVPHSSGSSVRSTKRSRRTPNPKLSSVLTVGSEQVEPLTSIILRTLICVVAKLYSLTFVDTRIAGHRHLNRDLSDLQHPKNYPITAKTIIKSPWEDQHRFAAA